MTFSLLTDFDRLSPAYPQNPILIIQAPILQGSSRKGGLMIIHVGFGMIPPLY